VLKDKPDRRRTSRATGPLGTAIVKVYASGRAPVVARRVRALAGGPVEPVVPHVLLYDAARHVVVLTDVPGTPFRAAILAGDTQAAARVGRALAGWHVAHRGRVPAGLRPHTAGREIEILLERCATAPAVVGELVRDALTGPHGADLHGEWPTDTVVHRDLYEEQIVLSDMVGLLDVDDAAAGPAELDLGNLGAHLQLLALRTGVDADITSAALLGAYAAHAPLDKGLLARCRDLSLLRLACLHAEPALVPPQGRHERTLIDGSPFAHGRAAG
jgi:Ser/Thr protein kinase RdoA (MazF antagonist)